MSGLGDFLARHGAAIRVTVAEAVGSTPREAGAEMFVAASASYGTIGGGVLEYEALERARKMLARGEDLAEIDATLGPESGQCCGGRVRLMLGRLDGVARAAAVEAEARRFGARPEVLIFGAGHIGRALARVLSGMPVRPRLIDARAEELAKASEVETVLSAMPEAELRQAGPGHGCVIATHDHALDFLLAGEALAMGRAAYIGMIGSKTKRGRFENWLGRAMPGVSSAALVSPMGRAAPADKRPEVIALFVAAELVAALASTGSIPSRMEAEG